MSQVFWKPAKVLMNKLNKDTNQHNEIMTCSASSPDLEQLLLELLQVFRQIRESVCVPGLGLGAEEGGHVDSLGPALAAAAPAEVLKVRVARYLVLAVSCVRQLLHSQRIGPREDEDQKQI